MTKRRSHAERPRFKRLGTSSLLAILAFGCTNRIPERNALDTGAANSPDGVVVTPGSNTGPQMGGTGPQMGGTGGSAPVSQPSAQARASKFKRLSRAELARVFEDVLGVRVSTEDLLPPADRGESGYEETYEISSSGLNGFLEAAERAASAALQPTARAALCQAASDSACVGELTQGVAKRLYKRTLTPLEASELTTVFSAVEAEVPGDGLRAVLLSLLISPQFLYLIEREQPVLPGAERPAVTGTELAARLALLLNGSMPSTALLELAESGQLNSVEQLTKAALPLLADASFRDSFSTFLEQWAFSERVAGISPSAERYPNFKPVTVASFKTSLADLLHRTSAARVDLQSTLFKSTDYYLDSALIQSADPLRAPDSKGELVPQDPKRRTGILTHPAFLAMNSNESAGDPIFRGLFVRRNVLCGSALSLPEGLVVEVPAAVSGETNRARYERILQNSTCAGCHRAFQPIGYAFENYDALGAYQERDGATAIDASAELAGYGALDGTFKNAVELIAAIADSSDVSRCLVDHWFRYAAGGLPVAEREADFARVTGDFLAEGRSAEALVRSYLQGRAFGAALDVSDAQ